jgi:nucleoside-diphosphate-sugar epimerase
MGIVYGVSPVMKMDPRFLAVPQRFSFDAARGEALHVATGVGSVLPFVHIDDVVDGLIQCRSWNGKARIVNIAGEVRSVASIAQAVASAAAASGIAVEICADGHDRRYAPRHIASALAATGFRAERRFEDAVDAILDHYRGAAPGPENP